MSERDPERALREAAEQDRAAALDLGDELARDALKARLFGGQPPVRHIGRYRVLTAIASGGMGTVLEARDEALGRTVAIKVVRNLDLDRSAEASSRLAREARAMAALSHPNVVQVYDTGTLGEDVYIAMEYVPGETLRTWLSRSRATLAPEAHRKQVLAHFIAVGHGLAAAHDIGLVHRDFKPDNVLLGDDGRARLTDFGLARHVTGLALAGPAPAATPTGDLLTRDGFLSGTPAYMAPEQLAGQRADARSDLFSFCVALYEALYGVRPYQGVDVADLRRAVECGDIDRGDGAPVPPWLRAVLLTGLAPDPAARPHSMRALIAALEKDPDALRRQRLVSAARSLVALAALALLVTLGRGALGWWQQHRAEALAAQRIARIELAVAEARATGDEAHANDRLEELFADADLVGTEALARAWLREGDRRVAAVPMEAVLVRPDTGVLDAYARAWTAARTRTSRVEALSGIAAELRRQGRRNDLAPLLRRLDQERGSAPDEAWLREARRDAALARRDARAAEALAADNPSLLSGLQALGQGTPTPYRGEAPSQVLPLALGPEASPAVVATYGRGGVWSMDVRAGLPDGDLLRSHPLTWLVLTPVRSLRGPTDLLAARDATGAGECALLRVGTDGQLVELARWAEPGLPLGAAAVDLDGDGIEEVYVGVGQGARDIFRISPEDDWSVRSVGEDVTLGSDVLALLPTDLDGDGAPELALGLGPWSAYEVRVTTFAPQTGRLRTRARRKLGTVTALAVFESVTQGRLLAAAKNDVYANIRVFSPDQPFGEPGGIYLLRLAGDALEEVKWIPSARSRTDQMLVADINGDGHDDILHTEDDDLLAHIQDADGAFASLRLGGVSPSLTLQADADPALELVANLAGWSQGGRVTRPELWVLGVGDRDLPTWTPGRWAAPAREPVDEILAPRLGRARALVDMGLLRQGAEAYESLAPLLSAPAEQSLARLWAATLREASGSFEEATALYLAAATAPELAADALEGALRGAMQPAQSREALALAEQALVALAPKSPVRARVAAARDEVRSTLDRDATLALGGGEPMPPGVHIGGAAALDRERGTLRVRSFGAGPLLDAEVDYGGGPIGLSLDAGFVRLEWSAGVQLELLDGEGRQVIGIPILARGGGGLVDHNLAPHVRGLGPHWIGVEEPARLEDGQIVRYAVRCVLRPDTDGSGCTIAEDGRLVSAWHGTIGAPEAGRMRLRLRALGEPFAACEAHLHRIAATGLTLREPPVDDPRDRGRRALIEGDLEGALAALGEAAAGPEEQATRLDLLLRLGRLSAGQAQLRAMLRDADGRAAILPGIRRRPELYLPLLAALDLRTLFPLVYEALALSEAQAPHDPRLMDEVRRATAGLDAYVRWAADQHPTHRSTARELLRWRAQLRAGDGATDAARADLERALALDRSLPGPRTTREEPGVAIRLRLAELALATGDRDEARAQLAAARMESARPELVEDLIAAKPLLHALAAESVPAL